MKARKIEELRNTLIGTADKRFPIQMMLVLGRNRKKLEEAFKDIMAQRDTLLERYGRKNEDGVIIVEGGRIKLKDPMKFHEEEAELYETEIEMIFDKFPMALLERCEEPGFDLPTVEETTAMECMIE